MAERGEESSDSCSRLPHMQNLVVSRSLSWPSTCSLCTWRASVALGQLHEALSITSCHMDLCWSKGTTKELWSCTQDLATWVILFEHAVCHIISKLMKDSYSENKRRRLKNLLFFSTLSILHIVIFCDFYIYVDTLLVKDKTIYTSANFLSTRQDQSHLFSFFGEYMQENGASLPEESGQIWMQ